MVVVVVVVVVVAVAVIVVVVAVVVLVVVVVVVVVVVEVIVVLVVVVKVKVIPQYAVKLQREDRCVVLPLYNLGARRGNTTPRPHYTKETEPIPIVQEAEWGALLFFSFRPSFNLVLVCLLYLLAFELTL